jgi:hypothetical protein
MYLLRQFFVFQPCPRHFRQESLAQGTDKYQGAPPWRPVPAPYLCAPRKGAKDIPLRPLRSYLQTAQRMAKERAVYLWRRNCFCSYSQGLIRTPTVYAMVYNRQDTCKLTQFRWKYKNFAIIRQHFSSA